MKTTATTAVTVLALAALLGVVAPGAHALTVSDITKDLTCTCGCNMVVSACEGTMECGPARQITAEAARLIDAGRSRDEIIAHFVSTRGERILAAPTKRGFNLTAWVLPFLAIFLGALGVIVFVHRCLAARRDDGGDAGAAADEPIDEKYLEQFESELRAFE